VSRFFVFVDETNKYVEDDISEDDIKQIVEEGGIVIDLDSMVEYKLDWQTEEYVWTPVDYR